MDGHPSTSRDSGSSPDHRSSADSKVWPRRRSPDAEDTTNPTLPGPWASPACPLSHTPCSSQVKGRNSHHTAKEVFKAIRGHGGIAPATFFTLEETQNQRWLHLTAVGKRVSRSFPTSTLSSSSLGQSTSRRASVLGTPIPWPESFPALHSLEEKKFRVSPSEPCTRLPQSPWGTLSHGFWACPPTSSPFQSPGIFLNSNRKQKQPVSVGKGVPPCCYCCSVAKSCPTLREPMACSTPSLPVLPYLPEFAKFVFIELVMPSTLSGAKCKGGCHSSLPRGQI